MLRFLRDWWKVLFLYALGGAALAVAWHSTAPRAECYLSEGACIWQMDQTSSPYFFADAIFGGYALTIGLGFGWFLAKKLQTSLQLQIGFVLLGTAVSFAAATLAESWNEIQPLTDPYALDALQLRSLPMLVIWPAMVQMFVVFRERVQNPDENPSEIAPEPEADLSN